jgi:hypothetical protein
MRKLFLLSAFVLLLSAWVVAQATAPMGGSSQSSSNANETSITGCLSGSGGSYTLTDASGKTYQLQGDTSKLSDEVGHQVRVKGSEASASAAGSPGTSPSSGSSASSSSAGSSAGVQFNVSSVKKISDSCSTSPTSK